MRITETNLFPKHISRYLCTSHGPNWNPSRVLPVSSDAITHAPNRPKHVRAVTDSAPTVGHFFFFIKQFFEGRRDVRGCVHVVEIRNRYFFLPAAHSSTDYYASAIREEIRDLRRIGNRWKTIRNRDLATCTYNGQVYRCNTPRTCDAIYTALYLKKNPIRGIRIVISRCIKTHYSDPAVF